MIMIIVVIAMIIIIKIKANNKQDGRYSHEPALTKIHFVLVLKLFRKVLQT